MAQPDLRELLSRARKKKGWGVDRVSRESFVSNNSLLLIEKGGWPEKKKDLLSRGTGKGRHTLQSWINIIVCSAYVLDENPKHWLEVAGLPCESEEIDRLIAEYNIRKNTGQKPVTSSVVPLMLTIADVDFIREVLEKIGGSIPLKTVLDLLECRKKNAKPSE